jgi:hypothetical protein
MRNAPDTGAGQCKRGRAMGNAGRPQTHCVTKSGVMASKQSMSATAATRLPVSFSRAEYTAVRSSGLEGANNVR